jgi:hypothetical protein
LPSYKISKVPSEYVPLILDPLTKSMLVSATWDRGEDGRDNDRRGAGDADITVSLKRGCGIAMHVEGVVVSWSKDDVRFICCGLCLRLNSGGRDAGADTVTIFVEVVDRHIETLLSVFAFRCVCPGRCLSLDLKIVASK